MQNMGINQLANMYMGNPQPLAAKVQQAQQQAKPGQIPPDLKEALALQQIQDMRQAAQNQQALQAGGPQPTVVDQLKQMIAQQQQPQGMPQGLPQGAMMRAPQGMPQGMPQQMAPQPAPQGLPQAAPQGMAPAQQPTSEEQAGLPQLPSSLGQHFAGGGIIAFAGEDGSYVSDSGEYYAEPLPAEARQNMDTGILKKLQEYMSRNLERDPRTGEVVRNPETGEPMRKTSNDIPRAAAPEAPYGNESRREVMPMKQGLPASPLVKQNPPAAPRPPIAPIAPPPTVNAIAGNPPAAVSPDVEIAQKVLRNSMQDPATARALEVSEYQKAIAAPDTTNYDRAVEELQRRKQQFAAPATGMPALMEYLQQIAQTPRGVGSLTAGAMGAQKVTDLQKAREASQFDLAKQIIDQEQKKLDVQRGYAKEVYGVGKERYNAMFEANLKAAKEVTTNDLAARRLAEEVTQKQLDRENELAKTKMHVQGQITAAGMPGAEQRFLNEMEALRLKDPKAYEAKMATLTAIKGAGAAGKGVMTRDQAADNVRKDLENLQTSGPMIKEAKLALQTNGIPNPTMQQVQEYLIQQNMRGVSLTGQPKPNAALFDKADAILAGSK
jgi:hypothetical protein